MKTQRLIARAILTAGTLLLAGFAQATTNLVFENFCYSIHCGVPCYPYFGPCAIYAPGTQDPTSGDCGSLYFSFPFFESTEICTGYVGYDGGTPSRHPATVDCSQYVAITLDILWDTTSGLTIDQFNTGTNWCYSCPTPLFTQAEPQDYMVQPGFYFTPGIDFELVGNGNTDIDFGNVNIPENAASGWQTMTIPIPSAIRPALTNINAITFSKLAARTGPPVSSNATGRFWIDNIVLIAPEEPPPPTPTFSILANAPVPGLNVWNLTEDDGYYDRNEVVAIATNQLSFAGSSNNPYPVCYPSTYSFNLAGFPTGANNYLSCEAYMFLIPNAANCDQAPDWNEANDIVFEVQSIATGSQATVSYKTNSPYSIAANNLAFNGTTNSAVQSAKIYGNYSLVFTSSNAGYVQVPDGTTGSFTLPAGVSSCFQENTSGNYPFLVYWGGQANGPNALNQAVAFSGVSITGVPNGFTENFVGETNVVNVTNGETFDPAGVFIVPTTAVYWVSWPSPSPGFVLENAANMSGPWQNTTCNPQMAGYGEVLQLVDQSDLLAPTNTQFFRLVNRGYTNILVALPGQSFVSGVGITGSPTSLHSGSNPGVWGLETAMAYAVDANNALVTTVNGDQILLDCTSDTAGTNDFLCLQTFSSSETTTMVNGVANLGLYTGFLWGYSGTLSAPTTETVTVTDQVTGFTSTSSPVSLVSP